MKTIWIGAIPEIFGYGRIVAGGSKEECLNALRDEYNEATKNEEDTYDEEFHEDGTEMTRFEKAMEYWGGDVFEVTAGKVYFDDFKY